MARHYDVCKYVVAFEKNGEALRTAKLKPDDPVGRMAVGRKTKTLVMELNMEHCLA